MEKYTFVYFTKITFIKTLKVETYKAYLNKIIISLIKSQFWEYFEKFSLRLKLRILFAHNSSQTTLHNVFLYLRTFGLYILKTTFAFNLYILYIGVYIYILCLVSYF